MLETMLEGQVLLVVMGTLAAVGVISKGIVNVTLKRLVRAAGNMNKSNHPFMRLVRAKFEHASMISDKVENVKVFVDKYLYEYKVMGIRLHGFRRMETVTAVLCLIAGALGAALTYRMDGLNEDVWTYGAAGAGLAVLVYLFHLTTDEKYLMDAIRNYMVDYLENVCRHRYEKEKTYQKGIKVLTQEGTAAEFGVMPTEDYHHEEEREDIREKVSREIRSTQAEQAGKNPQEEQTERIDKAGQRDRAEEANETARILEEIDRMSEIARIDRESAYAAERDRKPQDTYAETSDKDKRSDKAPDRPYVVDKEEAEEPHLARTRRPEGGKSAVSTFHSAERIADEAINSMLAANGKQVSQSEAMGAVLKAEAKRGETVKENIAELPAAEFVRETMEPKKRSTQDRQPKKERPEQELDRDLVIRRILEEFMA